MNIKSSIWVKSWGDAPRDLGFEAQLGWFWVQGWVGVKQKGGKVKRSQFWEDTGGLRQAKELLRDFNRGSVVGPGFAEVSVRKISGGWQGFKRGIVPSWCILQILWGWGENSNTPANELWFDYDHKNKKFSSASN